MPITINTTDPQGLLDAIKDGIKNKKIPTWEETPGGKFTHDTANKQWHGKAFLSPKVETDRLIMTALAPTGVTQFEKDVAGVYFGRFVEMLVNHFWGKFKNIEIS